MKSHIIKPSLKLLDQDYSEVPLILSHEFMPVLNQLVPMHILVGKDGKIAQVGPTLQKITGEPPPVCQDILWFLKISRPDGIVSFADLLSAAGMPFKAELVANPGVGFKGVIIGLPGANGVLINMRLGVSVRDAVTQFGLKGKDFSPADQTIDMLYLLEVQSALLQESKDLNNRLLRAKLRAEDQAVKDTLTGLSNRRALTVFLDRLISRRSDNGFALMTLDLDQFKAVNDNLGHVAGDRVLKEVAVILLSETRSFDMVARVGGDEFTIVFPELTDQKALRDIAARIISKLKKPININDTTCLIGGSIGGNISGFYVPVDVDKIVNDTDKALYASKTAGRGKFTFFHEM